MTLYLNNDGSRWIEVDTKRKRHMPIVLVLPDGTRKERQADYYESFGNFAVIAYRYQGKRFTGFGKDHEGIETRGSNDDGKTYIFHAKSRGYQAA